jgi:addiction module RelE/StbE family toxin
MTFEFELSPALKKQLNKLANKDKAFAKAIRNKISQIINSDKETILHFKNLTKELKEYKRVHVGSHFVLMFKIEGKKILFYKVMHHDKAYN